MRRNSFNGGFMADPKDAVDDELVDDAEGADADDAEGADAEGADADDAEGADAEGADADDAEGAGGDSSAGRRETRTQRLANEARTEREARIRLETENAVLRNNNQHRQDPDAARRAREEKLAIMDPSERAAFEANERVSHLTTQFQNSQAMTANMLDKIAFDNKVATNPLYAKHADAIEAAINNELAAGRVPPKRDILLRLKLGDDILKPVTGKKKKQLDADKAAAEARRQKANGKALGNRGDAGGNKKSGGDETLEEMRQRILDREARGDM